MTVRREEKIGTGDGEGRRTREVGGGPKKQNSMGL